VSLFVLPRQVPVSGGNSFSGALLHFYQTGTTTPETVYTSATRTVAHSNPVIADANGVFNSIWLDPTKTYRVRLTTSSGVLLYDVDPYPGNLLQDAIEATVTAAFIGEAFYPRTADEIAASVTPVSYQYPFGDIRRYGAVGDGTTNCNAAFTNAVAALPSTGGTITVPAGNYLVTSSVVIDHDRVFIVGEGPNLSKITFNPASTAVLFDFDKGANSVVQAGVRGLGFSSANTVTKTAIRLRDQRACVVEEIGISQGAWGGAASIFLHVLGRDKLTCRKINVLCARPILIDFNPNYATLHTDHFHFEDMEIGSTETLGKTIEIANGVCISNMTFDGYQAWVLGKYGIFWDDTTSTIDSFNLSISNARIEQASDATGHSIYLASTANDLKGLHVENVYFDGNRNGVYLRRPEMVTFVDCFFAGTTGRTNFDVTFTSRTELHLINAFVNTGSTVTFTDGVAVVEMPYNPASAAISGTAFWRFAEASITSRRSQRHDGVLSFRYKGSVADDAQLNLPVLSASGADVAVFKIAMAGATTLAYAHGAWKPGTAPDIYGTSGLVSNTSVDGDLCVINNSDNLSVINRLGETASVVIDVTWCD